jgi:phosphohistidine phosphatase SixA
MLSPVLADQQPDVPLLPARMLIVIRHAERGTSDDKNADHDPLTGAGTARSKLLVDALKHAGITKIYVTNTTRTEATADPIARELHIKPDKTLAHQEGKEGVKALCKLLGDDLAASDGNAVALIVQHHKNVHDFLMALGCADVPTVKDLEGQNDDVFILTPDVKNSRKWNMLHLQYGDPHPHQVP